MVAILIGLVGGVILTLSKSGAGSSRAGAAMIGAFIPTEALPTLGWCADRGPAGRATADCRRSAWA
jgi:hypothetical protein